MRFITNLFEELKELWSQADLRSRITFVSVTALMLLTFAVVLFWSSRPNFVALASDLSPEQSAQFVATLESNGIEYQLNYSGSTILVPQSALSRANMLRPIGIGPGTSPMETTTGPFETPETSQWRLHRKLESILAESIIDLHAVNGVKVHIAHADPSPFVRERIPTTASVILELQPGIAFTREQAQSIVWTVASAVPGLTPDHVTVTDTTGRIHSRDGSSSGSDITSQYEYNQPIETVSEECMALQNDIQSLKESLADSGIKIVDLDITQDGNGRDDLWQQHSEEPFDDGTTPNVTKNATMLNAPRITSVASQTRQIDLII